MTRTNITEIYFGDKTTALADLHWVIDYGQIIKFPDIELPFSYEVHFCNDGDDHTITMIGDANGVKVPDQFYVSGKLTIHAYIYLHTGLEDGETCYHAIIKLQDRPPASDEQPTPEEQSVITQTIAALDAAVEEAQAAVEAIQDMGVDAEQLPAGSEPTVTKSVDPDTGVVTLTFGLVDGEQGATGVGIQSISWNPDYTMTVTMTNGTIYTSGNLRGPTGAPGEDGNGIASAVLNQNYTLTLTFTDGTSYTTPSIRGEKGEQGIQGVPGADGQSASITGATVSVDANVGTPSVAVTAGGTALARSFDFAFHNLKGQPGQDGSDGFSPVVTVTPITGGHEVAVTDAEGTQTFDVMDGEVSEEQLETALIERADVIIKTVSGDTIKIPDGADDAPIKSMVVNISLEQEDAPWVGTEYDTAPYNLRPVSDASVSRIGNREMDMLIGGTVAWNQYIRNGNFSDGTSYWEITKTNNMDMGTISVENGVLTYAMSSGGGNANRNVRQVLNTPLEIGHKVLISLDVKETSDNDYVSLRMGFTTSSGDSIPGSTGSIIFSPASYDFKEKWARVQFIWEIQGNYRYKYAIGTLSSTAGSNISIHLKNVNVIDLTQMLGSTIADYLYTLESGSAGAGIAKAKSWGYFLKDYYPYSEGTLQSVQTSAHVMRGFNQWDEEWESGTIRTASGDNASDDNKIRSKNYIPVVPNSIYYFYQSSLNNLAFSLRLYDANKGYIGYVGQNANSTYTVPNGVFFIRFTIGSSANPVTSLPDKAVCINLSGSRNGQYEPYSVHSYPLDSDLVLRGIPKLDANNSLYYDGDTYRWDGSVTRRYGIVDLGTLTWYANSNAFYALPVSSKFQFDGICQKYSHSNANGISAQEDKSWQSKSDSGFAIWIIDSDYSDVASFKASLSGVYLVYELNDSTVITETADPYSEYQIVYADGTEEYVDERTVPIPVGHRSNYADIYPISGWTGAELYQSDGTSIPETTSVSWQSEAGTVYGGSWDVLTGVMTDSMGVLKLDSNIPSGSGGFRNLAILTDGVRCEYYPYRALGKGNSAKVYSDRFVNRDATTGTPYTIITNIGDPRLLVCLPLEYDTVDKFRAYFAASPLDIYYYKATPTTYQLTPHDDMTTLLGTNHFWADTGGIGLEYRCDTKTYVDESVTGVGNLEYEGEKIILKTEDQKRKCNSTLWKNFLGQQIPNITDYAFHLNESMTIYGGYVFAFSLNGVCTIIDYITHSIIGTCNFLPTDRQHANSAQFTDYYYDETDEFPLLLLSRCGNSASGTGDDECLVYRITRSGDTFTMTLINSIEPNFATYGTSWGIDTNTHYLYMSTTINGTWQVAENNPIMFCVFNCPSKAELISGTEIVLNESDMLARMYIDHYTLQGMAVNGGIIYTGITYNGQNVWAVDVWKNRILSKIKLESSKEVEGVAVYDGKLYVTQKTGSDTDGVNPMQIYELKF